MIDFVTIAKSANILKNFQNPGFSVFPEKPDPGSGIFSAQNHLVTKTELKKKFSQIGPAVLEEIGRKHTRKHRVAI